MDIKRGSGYSQNVGWLKKVKKFLGIRDRDGWVESQIREMAKLRGKLVL
jgi:hypothetical protein